MKKGVLITFDHKYKNEGKLSQQVLKKCVNLESIDTGVAFLQFKTFDNRDVFYKTEDILGIAEVKIEEEEKESN